MRTAWAVGLTLLLLTGGAPSAQAEPGLNWLAPDQAYAGQPIYAAYAIVGSEEPLMLVGHVNVELTVWLDDVRLWHSTSVHEHDGFHSLMVTPPTAGELRLEASAGGEETITKAIEVLPSEPDPTLQDHVAWTEPYHEAGTAGMDTLMVPSGAEHPLGVGGVVDVQDGAGRSLLSTWTHELPAFYYDENWGAQQAWFLLTGATHTPAPERDVGLNAASMALDHVAPDYGIVPAQPELPIDSTSCQDEGVTLVFDPESHQPQGLGWDWDTDIRLSVPDLGADPTADHRTRFQLDRLGPEEDAAIFKASADDPWGQLTFRAPEPGTYELHVDDGSSQCSVRFDVTGPGSDPLGLTADASPEPGTLEVETDVNGSTVVVELHAKLAGGDPNTHFEFDTRVYREGTDGLLAWKGKLHGHGGDASFSMAGLTPGDYVVQVYPAPQDEGAPPLATDDPDGFRYTFSVAQPAADAVTQDAPLGAGALLALAGAALVAAVRRRNL